MSLFFLRSLKILILFVLWISLGLGSTHSWASSDWHHPDSWGSDSPNYPTSKKLSGSYQNRNQLIFPFSPKSNNFAIDIGQIFLMGDMGANYSDSIGSQLHYTYGVSEVFAFDTSIGYSNHSDGKFSMLSGLAGLRTNLAWYDKVVPYAVLGLGFYRPNYQISNNLDGNPVINTVSSTLFGVHLGPGVDLELTKQLFFGAALTFHDVFSTTQPVNGGTLPVGGTYTSFLLHTGFTF